MHQIPDEVKAEKANREIQNRITQQNKAAHIQSTDYLWNRVPIFSKEQVTEILARVQEATTNNEPVNWEEVLPNYIYKALKAARRSIPIFINEEARLAGLPSAGNFSSVPLGTSDHLLIDADSNIEENYFKQVYDAKTNTSLFNLDRWRRYRAEFLNVREIQLNGGDK